MLGRALDVTRTHEGQDALTTRERAVVGELDMDAQRGPRGHLQGGRLTGFDSRLVVREEGVRGGREGEGRARRGGLEVCNGKKCVQYVSGGWHVKAGLGPCVVLEARHLVYLELLLASLRW